jgi:hypothetical protein
MILAEQITSDDALDETDGIATKRTAPNKMKDKDATRPHFRGDQSFFLPIYATIAAQERPIAPIAQKTPLA